MSAGTIMALPAKHELSAREIVDSLTVRQRTEALIGFVDAVLKLDAEGNVKRFHQRMVSAAQATERMLAEVPT